MSCIVYTTDRRTGRRYAYESASYRDPDTKRVRTKKTYLGRVDPDTGEIVPKSTEPGKRNRSPIGAGATPGAESRLMAEMGSMRGEVGELRAEVGELRAELADLAARVRDAAAALGADAGGREAS